MSNAFKKSQIPQYKCHKVVSAFKIGKVIPDGPNTVLFPDMENTDMLPFVTVGQKYMAKHAPQPGGYYVLYEDGYESYSPAEAFESGYSLLSAKEDLSFSAALELLESGKKVARQGWNGKGMWLKLVPASLADAVAFQHEALKPLPWIGMKTADEGFVPWLASQTDMLAKDWVLVR